MILMRESIDSFFCHILTDYEGTGRKTEALEYVIAHRGNDLTDVAEQYINAGMRQENVTILNQFMTSSVGDVIRDRKVDGLLEASQKTLLKMAQDKKLPLNPSVEHSIIEKGYFIYENSLEYPLDIREKGLSKVSKVEACLKWMNCLTEFCCGEPLFKEENQKILNLEQNNPLLEELVQRLKQETEQTVNTNMNSSQVIEAPNQVEEKPITFKELQPHEDFLQKLWEAGCLECVIPTRD